MATLRGIIRKMKGSVGDFTFRELNGQTTVSEKVGKNNSKTYAQSARRVRWPNLVNMWQAMSNYDKPSFESKPRTWSDFNAWMSANIDGVPIYLERSEAEQGATVVGPFQVTRGSLPAIDVAAGTGGVPVTDISLGSLTIDADTTLKEFSDAVIDNNTGYQHGDQISCFMAVQAQNPVTGIPYVDFKAMEVTLNQRDEDTLLADVVSAEGFSNVDGKIGASGAINGGIAWIHSRRGANRVMVSTQNFYVNNNLIARYQTPAKRIEAIESYGGKITQDFLTPNNDDTLASI